MSDSNLPKESFLQKIFSTLFVSKDADAIKRKRLRAVAKEISKSKYKIFKPSNGTALPGMGKFFFEIYKIIGNAQLMLSTTQANASLKGFVIEYCLSEDQKLLLDQLSEESIYERARKIALKDIVKQVKEDIAALSASFDQETIASIDSLYNLLLSFMAFVAYDYFFILKKFDSGMQERNFTYLPNFEPIRGEYVVDDLKDFMAVAWVLQQNADWTGLFKFLKDYKGVDAVPINAWNKLLARLAEVQRSKIFDMIIQISTQDPGYITKVTFKTERIIESYLEKIKTQTSLLLTKIEKEQTGTKIDKLVEQLFDSSPPVRLRYYTEHASAQYEKKMVGSFQFHQPLNYMKAFLIDYCKKEMRELSDLILIRGKWSLPNLSAQMSEAYYAVLAVSDDITKLDESLKEDAEIGQKIKTYIIRTERDKDAFRIVQTVLRDLNEQALLQLTKGSQNLVLYAKGLKQIIEDKDKAAPELILNWKEIEGYSERPIRDLAVDIYKKIFLFISLMQFFIGEKKE